MLMVCPREWKGRPGSKRYEPRGGARGSHWTKPKPASYCQEEVPGCTSKYDETPIFKVSRLISVKSAQSISETRRAPSSSNTH
ncbi:uncharacterized protein BO66DRAFT_388418 [Aspergillus aculeatinus CBS 121060]|uniref:Uncharacterized protein n=1 Tax=Aspergillus aculeatinus CBS 121060 TaxID=1448322 RepID=A0ACD1HL84_9EURO|nr:hypothetical protein BO66DRAFT_388418 [Aspergillus aculeatinus CBS 121060]RAH74358.1 hypothetical protein BO66DRAFT_388418 [Aspergillus aculeatinus CBS 121060]